MQLELSSENFENLEILKTYLEQIWNLFEKTSLLQCSLLCTLCETASCDLLDSRGETPNNSGRNSPVCWQPPSLATKNRNNSDLEQSKPKGFGAFNSIYDVGSHFYDF